jgi:hypothetical protein
LLLFNKLTKAAFLIRSSEKRKRSAVNTKNKILFEKTSIILPCDGVNIDGVSIGNRIYWALKILTTSNYDSLTELHTPKITVTTAHKVFCLH